MKKYEKIAEWIRKEVEAGALSLGDKLPSENELMAQFQVSRQTVRTALLLLRKEGIVEGRRGSGSYITANVHRRTGKEIRIAVLLTCVDSYIFPALLRGMEAGLSREGCTLQISVTENAVEKERMLLKEFLRMSSIDGLIAEPVKSGLPNPNLGLYRELKSAGVPVLFVNSFYPEIDIPYVSLNDQKAGYIAARHLAECGHTRIGGIFKADDGQGRRRYAGYMQALMERDLKIRSQDVIWIDSNEMADMEGESEKFLKRLEHCTACVCYNDEIACKLELILKKGGVQVPQDISIVGIDNSNLAELSQTPLTSLDNPSEELGRAAAEKIAACVKHGIKMDTQEFDPRLVIRNSVRMKTGEERKEEHAGTIKARSL